MTTQELVSMTIPEVKPIIKHIVISGGGPAGIKSLGILQHLEKTGFWNIENIETIYGTSVGSILAVLLALKFDDWKTLTDYIIYRPWHEALHIHINQIFDAFSKRGLFDRNLMEIFFKPVFSAKDLSLDITLLQFYEFSRIELHLFSLDINQFKKIDVSYKTHPNLSVLTAVQMSSAIPLLISPVCLDGMCCLDGGVLCNYPLKECIANGALENEIIGIRNKYVRPENTNNIIDNSSSILDYIMMCIHKLVENVGPDEKDNIGVIPNEVSNETTPMSFYSIKEAIYSQDMRQQLLDDGIETGVAFSLLSSLFFVQNRKE